MQRHHYKHLKRMYPFISEQDFNRNIKYRFLWDLVYEKNKNYQEKMECLKKQLKNSDLYNIYEIFNIFNTNVERRFIYHTINTFQQQYINYVKRLPPLEILELSYLPINDLKYIFKTKKLCKSDKEVIIAKCSNFYYSKSITLWLIKRYGGKFSQNFLHKIIKTARHDIDKDLLLKEFLKHKRFNPKPIFIYAKTTQNHKLLDLVERHPNFISSV